MKTPNKTRRLTVRWSDAEWQQVVKKAQIIDKTPSALVRLCTLDKSLVAATDMQTALELRRIGRMLKGLYPKDANWSKSEQARYWACMNQLLTTASHLDGKSHKKEQPKDAS